MLDKEEGSLRTKWHSQGREGQGKVREETDGEAHQQHDCPLLEGA